MTGVLLRHGSAQQKQRYLPQIAKGELRLQAFGVTERVQFPIARAHIDVEAADLMRFHAAALFDRAQPCGAEANMAKLLAADASWEAANVALQTHGGFGFAEEYDIERKFSRRGCIKLRPSRPT